MLHIAIADASPLCCSFDKDRPGSRYHNVAMSKNRVLLHYLKEWREFRGMTQEQLAAAIKPATNASVISLIESGNRRLSDKWARRLAPALKIAPGWLLDNDPNTMDGRVMETWGLVPAEMREQAFKTLESFAKLAK
jgi:transcriptional regulator with XRE-family HTH domain